MPNERRVVVVTGLAGAGLATALKSFEDLGYEAVDNLPIVFLAPLIADLDRRNRPLAVGIDTRTRDFSAAALTQSIQALRGSTRLKLVFVTAADEVLERRFTETRRRHPLAQDRPVADGIAHERMILEPLAEIADLAVDTTELSIHDLRRLLAGHFALTHDRRLTITVTSFSFRHGLPREADLVFDVRFLRNPYYDPVLKALCGQDAEVARYIEEDPAFPAFFDRLSGFVLPLLAPFRGEGKSYLTIAIGCTGGRHRSVYTAERLARVLGEAGAAVGVRHRDMARHATGAAA